MPSINTWHAMVVPSAKVRCRYGPSTRRPGQAGREAEVVLDAAARAGLAPRSLPLDEDRAQPLGAAVDGGREAGRPRTHDGEVVEGRARAGLEAHVFGHLRERGGQERRPVRHHDHGEARGRVEAARDVPALLRGFHVEELVGDLVACQELFYVVGAGGPAVAHDLETGIAGPEPGLPVLEQVVEHRVEALLGRIPGLEQVVVHLGAVDGGDRRVRFSVGREQHPLRGREALTGLGEQRHPVHLGHALVGQDEGEGLVPRLQLFEDPQTGRARLGTQDPVVLAVTLTQIARHRAQHVGIVVHDEEGWTFHDALSCPISVAIAVAPSPARPPSDLRQP
jgi:hypothetical protein